MKNTIFILALVALATVLPVNNVEASNWAGQDATSSLVNQGGVNLLGHENTSNEPLGADEAFSIQARVEGDEEQGAKVALSLTPESGYYIYRESLDIQSSDANLGELQAPSGTDVDDVNFGLQEVFKNSVEVSVPVVGRVGEQMEVEVFYQGCMEGSICYPPMSKSFTLQAPDFVPIVDVVQEDLQAGQDQTAMAEDQRLAQMLSNLPAWQSLAVFLGLGVLLGLTPCVLPMVPILLGVVVGPGSGTGRTAGLAGVYVFSHAIVFAGMGAAAAAIGGGVSAMFQSAWMILPMATLLAGLGLAMLMRVDIQMPARVQAWAGTKGGGGTVKGAAVMGGLSSLIIGPCVAAPLAGAVLYLAHTGDVLMGSAALFSLGLGMGVPMLLMATGMGRWLPRSEKIDLWMRGIFGVAFVGLSAWLAMRVMPGWAVAGLGGGVFLAFAGWRYAKNTEQESVMGQPWAQAAVLGTVMLAGGAGLWIQQPADQGHLQDGLFTPVASNHDLNRALMEAQDEGKTTVVEFYAHWCTTCKDMERRTYSTPAVQLELRDENTLALKIDVTENNEQDREMMKRFGIIGPPATLFFNDKTEARDLRLIGFEASEPFAKRIQAAKCRAGGVNAGAC